MFRILLLLLALMLSPLALAGGKKPAASAEETGASQPNAFEHQLCMGASAWARRATI